MPSAGYLRRQADICLRLALIASDEEASGRLLEKLGFYFERMTRLGAEVTEVRLWRLSAR